MSTSVEGIPEDAADPPLVKTVHEMVAAVIARGTLLPVMAMSETVENHCSDDSRHAPCRTIRRLVDLDLSRGEAAAKRIAGATSTADQAAQQPLLPPPQAIYGS
jgi:hypothetical protein